MPQQTAACPAAAMLAALPAPDLAIMANNRVCGPNGRLGCWESAQGLAWHGHLSADKVLGVLVRCCSRPARPISFALIFCPGRLAAAGRMAPGVQVQVGKMQRGAAQLFR